MTIDEYQQEALRTAATTTKEEFLINGVMGLNGEAGECIDIVKKHIFQKHPLDATKLAKELGDVAWYLAVTAHAIDLPLSAILEGNVQKLRARYPEGFDQTRSVNRQPGDI